MKENDQKAPKENDAKTLKDDTPRQERNFRETLKQQILDIRDSGKTNMFDRRTVQRLAGDLGYFELACFVKDRPKKYADFIMSGNEELLAV